MQNEMWINNQEDYDNFCSYLKEENIFPLEKQGEDPEGNTIVKAGEFLVHIPKNYKLTYQECINKYDPLIFGKGQTEQIVNVTVDNEQVFIYKSDGSVDIQDYSNWAIGSHWDEGCSRLKGNQYYKYIKDLPEDQFYSLKESWNPRIWTPRTASEGFLLRSGETYYKGMKVSDVSLLSFDIETTGLDKLAFNAEIPLLSTTFRDTKGKIESKMFDIFEYYSKKEMWTDINNYIKDKNPDIILGHNILSFDLPYSNENSNGGLFWGRDKSKLIFNSKSSKMRKDGSQSYEFNDAQINGREIIDTFFLSIKYDLSREFPSYGLKAIEKHLGLVKEDRSWNFKQWSVEKLIEAKKSGNNEIWNNFRNYCSGDSLSPIKLFDLMIPSFFYLAQTVPLPLQQIVNTASGSHINSFLVRSYLQNGESIPKSDKLEEHVEGGISFGVPGLYKNVVKVDLKSAYPSQILRFKLFDKEKDPKGHFYEMVKYFTNERFELQDKYKETEDKYYKDREQTGKTFINSAYGVLNTNFLNFNSPKLAAKITLETRNVIDTALIWASGKNVENWMKIFREKTGKDEESN